MKRELPISLAISILLIFFFSCEQDDELVAVTNQPPEVETNICLLNEDLTRWIDFYNEKDQKIQYRNAEDSVVNLVVQFPYDENTNNFADCEKDGEAAQCQYEGATIKFPEGTHPSSNFVFVSMFLMGDGDLRIMPTNGGGIVISAARFNESTEEIKTEQSENFEAKYKSDYIFDNEPRQAIFVKTNSIENLATGGVIIPKRLTLVKGIGIVEFDDYLDNTWFLEY